MLTGAVTGAFAGSWEPLPHVQMLFPTLILGEGGAWSYGNLICHALLNPMGGLPFSEGILRSGEWVGRREGEERK